MRLLFPMAVFTVFIFIFLSCNSGKETEVEPQDKPYTLEIPSYFSKNYDVTAVNKLTVAGVELGRMLFYEKKLSGDNSMSCENCHQQSKAFTDGNAVSLGIDGITGTKSSMSLSNLLWENNFFWDGRTSSLEDQAKVPIQDPIEMHEDLNNAVKELQATSIYPPKFKLAFGSKIITADNIANALAQFERTLVSSKSKFDKYQKNEYTPTDQELRGIALFRTHPDPSNNIRGGNCGDCHLGALLNGDQNDLFGFHNNGLDNEANLSEGLLKVTGNLSDKGKFRVPNLRNIELTAPYMHDGRFKTLEEVLDHYNEHIQQSKTLDPLITAASNEKITPGDTSVKLHLTEQEKQDIIAFLKMLSDEEFITDKRFSNPFKE